MTDADDLPAEHPVLATALIAVVGVVGYAVPTALFGRPVDPLPTAAFAGGFTALYWGLIALDRYVPALDLR
jgi:hypothetical protein